MDRRAFIAASFAALAAARYCEAESLPLRFAHRQATLAAVPGDSVFEVASQIPGLSGVELQMIWKGTDLSTRDTGLNYKRAANRWGIKIPSIAGVWRPGASILKPKEAELALADAIRTAEMLGASTILVAMYGANCPSMQEKSSYEPVVSLLQRMATSAENAGVVLGLETSLAPADELKLHQLIDRPVAVGSYYDIGNEETYHPGDGPAGIRLLGKLIVQAHLQVLKNEPLLLGDKPAHVDWDATFKAYRDIGYSGWFVFESRHAEPEQLIAVTAKNIAFVTARMAGA